MATTATAGSGVGAYPVNQGTLAAGPNYAITYNPGTLTVTTAALTVTANSPSKVYGAALPALTYTFSGLVNGDTSAVFTGASSTSATVGSGVGAYPVTRGPLAAVRITRSPTAPAPLTVTTAALTVTANSPSKVYGAALPALTYTYSGLVNGDTSSVFTGTLATTATWAGGRSPYPVNQGTLAAGPNYAITYNPGTLTITTAALTVTANSLGKVYGAALPALTYTYSGLVNGDTSSVSHGRIGDPGHGGRGVGPLRRSIRGHSRPARITRSATIPAP